MAISIVIEGVPSAGKTTQADFLHLLLKETSRSEILRINEPPDPETRTLINHFMDTRPNGIVIEDCNWLGNKNYDLGNISLYYPNSQEVVFLDIMPQESHLRSIVRDTRSEVPLRNIKNPPLEFYEKKREELLKNLNRVSGEITLVNGFDPIASIGYGLRQRLSQKVEGFFPLSAGDMNGWIIRKSLCEELPSKEWIIQRNLREQLRIEKRYSYTEQLSDMMRSDWIKYGLLEGTPNRVERRF